MRNPRHRAIDAATAALLAAVACAGCAVGPDFKRPAAPHVERYTVRPLPQQTEAAVGPAGAAQVFTAGERLPDKWWTLYGSPSLDAMVEQALRANPNVQSGRAALRKAHENVLAAWGVLAPSVDASADGTRQRISGAQFGPSGLPSIFNLYNASVSVSYGLDFFGGARRELESLRAQRDYQRFVLQATYLTLSANVVTAAIAEASVRAQLQATEALVAASAKRLDMIRKQQQLGGASQADVLAQQAQLAQDRANLPVLRRELDQQRSLLATLLGQLPSDQPEVAFHLADLQLPATIPISVPSDLVAQRPDVRQQEELLHQASAEVGVATSNMLPKLTLNGSYGGSTQNWDELLKASSRVWSLSASVTQPVFHGGQLFHRRRAAVAAYDQAAAQYRDTVLNAFRNVADALRALTADAETLSAVHDSHAAAAASLAITDRQYAVGAVSYLTLLTAQRTEQQTRVSLIQAQAARLADTAALFQALGGGWSDQDVRSAQERAQPTVQ